VVYLLGLAAGSAVGGRWVERLRRPARAFGLIEIALGSSAALSVAAFGLVLPISTAMGGWPGWSGHASRVLTGAAVVMALPTFLMGLLFPVAGRLHAEAGNGVGRRIGSIYAVNTAGAVLGAFAASHLLLPALGSQGAMWLLAALNLGVGGVVLVLDRAGSPRGVALRAVVLAAPVAIVWAALPPTFLIERFRTDPRARLIHADEGAAGTVTVHEYPDDLRVLRVNGAGEVPTDRPSIRVFRLLGTLPLVVHDDPQEILVIAFGGGITLAAVEAQQPARIDCVELVPQVLGAAPLFERFNGGVFRRVDDGRIQLIFDDGRNHVLRTERHYDVIISDSTHPATADSWVLYTEEFYRLSRERLRPGGIFAQWLPIHGLTVDDYRMILRTFRVAFPHATLWTTRGYSVLLGTPEPLSIDYRRVVARLGGEAVRGPLAEVGLDRAAAFLATLALDAPGFGRFAGEGPTNTDDRPYIGFGDRQRAGTGSGRHIVAALHPHLVSSAALRIEGADVAAREAIAHEFAARRAAPP
jgi:spermidine synthase